MTAMIGEVVPREAYLIMLRMLVKRATPWDRLRARLDHSHWLNWARREISLDTTGKGLFD